MKKLLAKYHAFMLCDEGATAIEYGLIAGGISLAIVAAVFAFGGDLKAVFTKMSTTMSTVSGKVGG
jgi:pilus assembly protein Flp/PilA